MSTMTLRRRYTIPGLSVLTMRESMLLQKAGLRTIDAVRAATDDQLTQVVGLNLDEVAHVRHALLRAPS
jgi:hypothetical protein